MTTWLLWLAALTIGPALVQRTLGRALIDLCGGVDRELRQLGEAIDAKRTALREALGRYLDAEGLRQGEWRWSLLVGSLVLTVAFVICLALEWEAVALTLGALGWAGTLPQTGINVAVLVGTGVVLPMLTCLWTLSELWFRPRFLQAALHSRGEKIFWTALCVTACTLSFAAIPALGMFRLESARDIAVLERQEQQLLSSGAPARAVLNSTPVGPAVGGWRETADIVAIVMIPMAVTLATATAWHFGGSVLLLQLLPAGVLALLPVALSFAGTALKGLRMGLGFVYMGSRSLLAFLAKVGTTVVRPVITGTRLGADWARQELESPRKPDGASLCALAACVLTLTSWSRDVEIPDEPIGDRVDFFDESVQPSADAAPSVEPGAAEVEDPAAQESSDSTGNSSTEQRLDEEVDANWDPYRR